MNFYVCCFEAPDGSTIIGKVEESYMAPDFKNLRMGLKDIIVLDPMHIILVPNPQNGQLAPVTLKYAPYRDGDEVIIHPYAMNATYKASKEVAFKYEEAILQWKVKSSGLVTDPKELRKFHS